MGITNITDTLYKAGQALPGIRNGAPALKPWPSKGLLDIALLVICTLLALSHITIFLFHLLFVLLTIGAFYWQLRGFIVRACLWVSITTLIVARAIIAGDVHVQELIEIPMLTAILLCVFFIARRRSIVEEQLRESNEQLETRIADRTQKLSLANAALRLEIQKHQQTEKTLQEREEQYRQLVECSSETIVIHQQGRIVYMNPSGQQLFGARSTAGFSEWSLLDFVQPEDLQISTLKLQRIAHTMPGVSTIEQKFVRGDGTIIDAEMVTMPFHYQGYSAMQTVIRDVTSYKQAEVARRQERLRIGRDLHDSLGQTLGYLHLQLDHFANSTELADSPASHQKLTQLRTVANSAYEQVRQLLSTYLSANQADLVTLLHEKVHAIGCLHQVDIQMKSEGAPLRLPAYVQQEITYICCEALHNVTKHAAAKQVTLSLDWQATALVLAIQDDGCGFDINHTSSPKSFGLRIMRERAKQISATLTLSSTLASGTTVTLRVPLNP